MNDLLEVSPEVKSCILLAASNYEEYLEIIREAGIHKEYSRCYFVPMVLRDIYLPEDVTNICEVIFKNIALFESFKNEQDVDEREILYEILNEVYEDIVNRDI